MAWSAPMTAVANAVFTAAQFNTNVRDNLLETAPAKATNAGGYFVTNAANQIVERVAATATVATSQFSTNTSFADMGTVGPAVTVTTGTQALVTITADMFNATAANKAVMGWAVSGATTVAASDAYSISAVNSGTAHGNSYGATFLQTGLTSGSNTFTAKYRSNGGATQATFQNRYIVVMPL